MASPEKGTLPPIVVERRILLLPLPPLLLLLALNSKRLAKVYLNS